MCECESIQTKVCLSAFPTPVQQMFLAAYLSDDAACLLQRQKRKACLATCTNLYACHPNLNTQDFPRNLSLPFVPLSSICSHGNLVGRNHGKLARLCARLEASEVRSSQTLLLEQVSSARRQHSDSADDRQSVSKQQHCQCCVTTNFLV